MLESISLKLNIIFYVECAMARGINKVILIGNLGNDPELKSFPDGGSLTNVSIATSESWKDKTTGQQQERTEWHRVVFRNRLAEIVAQYLKKGSKVYIEGSLRTRKWDKNGVDMYTTEIHASQMQMLDSKGDAGGGFAPQQNTGGFQQNQQAPQQNYQNQQNQQAPQQNQQAPQQNQQAPQGQPQQQPAPAPSGFDDFDDDIPF